LNVNAQTKPTSFVAHLVSSKANKAAFGAENELNITKTAQLGGTACASGNDTSSRYHGWPSFIETSQSDAKTGGHIEEHQIKLQRWLIAIAIVVVGVVARAMSCDSLPSGTGTPRFSDLYERLSIADCFQFSNIAIQGIVGK
jgi:hypothetical protein